MGAKSATAKQVSPCVQMGYGPSVFMLWSQALSAHPLFAEFFFPLEVCLRMGPWCCSYLRFWFSLGLMFCLALKRQVSKAGNYHLISYTVYQEPNRMTGFSFKKSVAKRKSRRKYSTEEWKTRICSAFPL